MDRTTQKGNFSPQFYLFLDGATREKVPPSAPNWQPAAKDGEIAKIPRYRCGNILAEWRGLYLIPGKPRPDTMACYFLDSRLRGNDTLGLARQGRADALLLFPKWQTEVEDR